jgi:Inner membrane protein YgaP-like, transmembrane domain
MSLDRAVLAFAGFMVLLSVALTVWVSPLFAWFTVFIGLNMIQSAFTGFCPAAFVLRRLGLKSGVAFS